jgi:hypothetical protein
VFTDYVDVELIDLEEGQGLLGSTRELNFGEVSPNSSSELTIWVENPHMEAATVSLESPCQFLSFPTPLRLRADERVRVPIRVDLDDEDMEIDDFVILRLGDIEEKVRVRARVAGASSDFEAEVLNFGVCEVGRLSRGILRLLNKKSEDSRVTITVDEPFSTPRGSVAVKSKCFVLLSVHFLPKEEGSFQEEIRFEPNNSRPFSVPVLGSATAAFWRDDS